MKPALVVVALVVSALLGWSVVASRLGVGTAAAGVTDVTLHLNDFAPDAISVPAGTTVTWHFQEGVEHNVVGDGFVAPDQDGGTFRHTFDEPGTYDYRCTLHGPMRGRVTVT